MVICIHAVKFLAEMVDEFLDASSAYSFSVAYVFARLS